MRIVLWVGMVACLAACSDDTKAPADLATVKDQVTKVEAKAGDGPAIKKEGGSADQAAGKDGAATGTSIGPAGGQAKSPDGKFVLDVPAGSLKSSLTFYLSKPAGKPSGTVVGTWSTLAGAVTDTAKGTVTAKVDHLTCYCSAIGVDIETTVEACISIETLDPIPPTFVPPATLTAPIAPPQGPGDWKIFWKNGKCPDTCGDGIKNGQETDVDCGGGTCPKCLHGKTCCSGVTCSPQDHGNCAGGHCSPATKKCDDCGNTKKDGAETDVDCGGGTCPKCAAGKACAGASDCQTSLCTANLCTTPGNCGDSTKNGDETDVDCGGSCTKCALGKLCLLNSDCASGLSCQSASPGQPKTCVSVQP